MFGLFVSYLGIFAASLLFLPLHYVFIPPFISLSLLSSSLLLSIPGTEIRESASSYPIREFLDPLARSPLWNELVDLETKTNLDVSALGGSPGTKVSKRLKYNTYPAFRRLLTPYEGAFLT